MRPRVWTVLAAVMSAVLLPFPSPAAEGDGAALLAKHAAYVGWSAGDGKVKSLRKTGKVLRDGRTTTYRSLWLGIAYRDTVAAPSGLTYDSGFTGRVPWVSNANGFTLQPAGETLKLLFDDQALFGEEMSAFTGSRVLRQETVGGVATTVVRLTSGVGFPVDVAIDPATGAYKRIVIDPGGRYETSLNDVSYVEVQGKRFIARWRRDASKTVVGYDTVEVDPPIQPDDLRPPKQTATWTFGEGVSPIELTATRIKLLATVNGVQGTFVFDTGASQTAFTPAFVDRAKGKRFSDTRVGGIAGVVSAGLVRIDSIAIGGSTLRNVVASDAVKSDSLRREGIDGLLGGDVLGGAVVALDLDAKTIRIMDPTKVAPTANGLVLHPDLASFSMRVPMKLDNRIDVIALLDSGNPGLVLFSDELLVKDRVPLGPDPNELARVRLGAGISGGVEIERCGTLDELSLGPIVYRPVPGCSSPSFARNEMLVGLEFMRAFNYVFDYPDGIVVLQKRRQP